MKLLLALVPLAMASCPCPPSDVHSSVCGTDHRTYSSECALVCANNSGIAVLHTGRCTPTPLSHGFRSYRSVRASGSSLDNLTDFTLCTQEKKCPDPTSDCGCTDLDVSCRDNCTKNYLDCVCPCGGFSVTSWSNVNTVGECTQEKNCHSTMESCRASCPTLYDSVCQTKCVQQGLSCQCQCNSGTGSIHNFFGLTIGVFWSLVTLSHLVAKNKS